MKTKSRFNQFKSALLDAIGYRAIMEANERITVIDTYSNSVVETFTTLQRAIDHYARFMPDEIK